MDQLASIVSALRSTIFIVLGSLKALSATLIALTAFSSAALAQDFPILDISIRPDGRAIVTVAADAQHYYLLYRGEVVTDIRMAVDVGVPTQASLQLVDPDPAPAHQARFFKVERISLANPRDTDGDGMNDVLEIQAGTDPLRSDTASLTTFISSPTAGEGDVSVTRETILRFSNPLASDATIGNGTFFASYGGRKLLSRVELSSDKRTATLFYLETVPASARIRVTFMGDSVPDFLGRPVDADANGIPGGIAEIDFDTLSITPVGQTAIIGRVFASELVPDPNGTGATVNKPLAGVTVTVDGAEETLRAVTDALGNFTLQPCPAGKFFVHIDGRTATLSQYPNGNYYPSVGKQWEAVASKADNLAGGTGEIYLPLITTGTLQLVSATADTTITFPASIVASNAALAGVSITVPANALFSDSGTRGGRVGIAPVSPNRLPGPLPPGLEFPLVITVQTDGGQNFDRPVPICFPNLPDPGTGEPLAPGEVNYLYSFNHDKGEWEAIGAMTVNNNGRRICTDQGVGIVQPGWHGSGPPPTGPPPCPPPGAVEPVCCLFPPPPGPPPSPSHSPTSHRSLLQTVAMKIATPTPSPTPAPSPCFLPDCRMEREKCLSDCFREKASAYVKCLDSWEKLRKVCAMHTGTDEEQYECYSKAIDLEKVCQRIQELPCPCPECEPLLPASLSSLSSDLDSDFRLRLLGQELNQLLKLIAADLKTLIRLSDATLSQIAAWPETAKRIAGGNVADFLTQSARNAESGIDFTKADNWVLAGNAPPYPILYRAIVARPVGVLELRGLTKSFGNYSLFLPRDSSLLSVEFVDTATRSYGAFLPRESIASRLPRVWLSLWGPSEDLDGDQLPDFVESVIGTSVREADTDRDGIPDGAEIDNGTNPLDGLAVATGIIASADTPGTAVDICAINNIAIVADSEAGISVFNVLAGLNPVRIAQVNTPGTALAVACSGNLIAVADAAEGLQIVDISDPPAARIVRQIGITTLGGGAAQAVASAADLAFVGTTQGSVSMVELASGLVLQRLELGGRVEDLAVEGTTLYAYANGKLHPLPFALGPMVKAGSVDVPAPSGINNANGRGRLFVGNNLAYAVHTKGYDTFDVANATAPKLITAGNTPQFGWKQIVLNGSGSGLAAFSPNQAFDGPHHLGLFDTSNPTVTDGFLTQFETPGIARSVSIYNGLAYVADHKNGLHVVNYLAYDSKKQPPTGELNTSSTDGTATGGGFMVLRAEVNDDVQVRNVEFYVDGTRLAVDGNFPFETVYRVPANATGNTLMLSARIFDTGGNSVSVTNALNVVPDNQPPGITIESPKENQLVFLGDDVPIRVTALDNSGIAAVTFALNGQALPVRRVSFYEWLTALSELPTGTNTLTAIATDFAGLSATSNPVRLVVLKEAISREISVFNFGAADHSEAISREVTTFNFGPLDTNEGISREVTTFNFGAPDKVEGISREVTTFNFGRDDTAEAISREISVENEKPTVGALRDAGQR
ncbi:MAG: Ig-like domain-containing protein [Limisphaerales bacterium]